MYYNSALLLATSMLSIFQQPSQALAQGETDAPPWDAQ